MKLAVTGWQTAELAGSSASKRILNNLLIPDEDSLFRHSFIISVWLPYYWPA